MKKTFLSVLSVLFIAIFTFSSRPIYSETENFSKEPGREAYQAALQAMEKDFNLQPMIAYFNQVRDSSLQEEQAFAMQDNSSWNQEKKSLVLQLRYAYLEKALDALDALSQIAAATKDLEARQKYLLQSQDILRKSQDILNQRIKLEQPQHH